MKAVFITFALTLVSASYGTVIINECQEEIHVAYARKASWGTDGLNEGGSVSQIQSVGWFRIGPGQREEAKPGYSHLLIIQKGVLLSRHTRGEDGLMGACMHPTDGFDRKVTERDNQHRQVAANHPISECLFVPGQVLIEGYATKWQWVPYQKFEGDTYTVFANSCAKGFTPLPGRHVWKYRDGKGTAQERYFVWNGGKEWVLASPLNGRETEPTFTYQEQTEDWVRIRINNESQMDYILGKDQSMSFVNGQWLKLADGYWQQ